MANLRWFFMGRPCAPFTKDTLTHPTTWQRRTPAQPLHPKGATSVQTLHKSNSDMKVYDSHEIKNIALLGNDGSGKTTLTEALLFESGLIKRRGRITAKTPFPTISPLSKTTATPSSLPSSTWNGRARNSISSTARARTTSSEQP